MLITKPCTGAAKATDHFIDHQEHIIFSTDFLHPLPVTLWWYDNATTSCDRLKNQAAHGIRTLTQDDILNRIGRTQTVSLPKLSCAASRYSKQ